MGHPGFPDTPPDLFWHPTQGWGSGSGSPSLGPIPAIPAAPVRKTAILARERPKNPGFPRHGGCVRFMRIKNWARSEGHPFVSFS